MQPAYALSDLLARFDLFLFDMDGTLVLGKKALPGAADLLAALRAANKTVRFVTNNTLHEPGEHAERLNHAGIAADAAEILTPLPALQAYIRDHGIKAAHIIASDVVKDALKLPQGEDVIILGLCRNWDYAQLQQACNLALKGVKVVMCQPDPYCPDPDGPITQTTSPLRMVVVMPSSTTRSTQPFFSTHCARRCSCMAHSWGP